MTLAILQSGLNFAMLQMPERPYRARIRSLMVERGWTQTELASRASLSQSVISRFLGGATAELDVLQLEKIADAFEVAAVDLLPRPERPEDLTPRLPVPQELAPFIRMVAEQPVGLRRQLEQMARVMVTTWSLAQQEVTPAASLHQEEGRVLSSPNPPRKSPAGELTNIDLILQGDPNATEPEGRQGERRGRHSSEEEPNDKHRRGKR